MNDIMVSVCMLCYNHEKYIRKAIESVLMQKTNFKFELLIHDDASTDKSADIIKEYEEKYPDIVKPIYQKENQYSKGVRILWTYQYSRVKGKYIAFCEGDDCWSSENKLQEQFDALENNELCSVCIHNVVKMSEDGIYVLGTLPEKPWGKEIIPAGEFTREIMRPNRYLFQTTSFFLRTKYIKEILNRIPEFIKAFPVGDMAIILYYATKGDVAYIDKYMSCYRVNAEGSFTRRSHSDKNYQIKVRDRFIKGMDLYNEYTGYIYDEYAKKYNLFHEYILDVLNKRYSNLKQKKYKVIYSEIPLIKKMEIKAEIISGKLKIPRLYDMLYKIYREKIEAKRWETIDEFNKKNNINY